MNEQIQKRTVVVSGLQTKDIQWMDRATNQQKFGTIYQVVGNDNQLYETGSKEFYDQLKVGQSVELVFKVVQKTGNNGRIYVSNKLIVPSKTEATNQVIQEILSEVKEIKAMLQQTPARNPGVGATMGSTPVTEQGLEGLEIDF